MDNKQEEKSVKRKIERTRCVRKGDESRKNKEKEENIDEEKQ
jgi:hypothetical protein